MGEAFLVGGSSAMSSSGAVKSRQTIEIDKKTVSSSDHGFHNTANGTARYSDFTINEVNIKKSVIIINSCARIDDMVTFLPAARFINSNTIRVYENVTAGSGYIVGTYVQIVEFY